jgi:hypothetical protein
MYAEIPFDRVQHLIRVPVRLGGDEYRFLVDTGIGVTIVSSAVAGRPDVEATAESFAGRRMSGQAVEVPLVRLPRLDLGGYAVDGHPAAVVDLGDLDGPNGFAGIIGPGFFEHHVVTTDSQAMTFTVRPAEDFAEDGVEIPLEIRRNGPSRDPFTRLVLPSGRQIVVEVDTGSHNLILDTRLMADCGIAIDDPGVTTKRGTDETGYEWIRRWAAIEGSVHLAAAPQTAQLRPLVQFQDIIHDGLIGAEYLERYRFHFDVSGARLILSPFGVSAG